MERVWRALGVQLGKYWQWVLGAVVVLTGVLAVGFTRVDFATGQESYLNSDSQIAIDNVEFQDTFGGETIVFLFVAGEGTDVTDLFEGANLDELERVQGELGEIDQVYASVDPLTALTFSHNLLEGGQSSVAGGALTAALVAEEEGSDGAAARLADAQVSIARLGAIPEDDKVIGNPAWNEMLIFDNTGFTLGEDNAPIPPDDFADRRIRKSLQGVFPGGEHRHVVGGVVLTGNASLDEQSAATEAVVAVMETAEFEGFDLTLAGSPLYLKEINDYLQGGMLTLGAAAVVVMAIVLLVMFRVRWRLLPLLACLIGVAWAFSLLGYIGLDLSLVTISGLPILIGLGIDFAIQIHNRVEEEVVLDHAEHPMSETLANIVPALIVATIAAVVAFLAMQVSLVPMIRDFGVLLAIGVVVLLAVGVVVPTAALGIREWKTPTTERKVSIIERITVKLGSLPTRLGTLFIAASIVIFGIGVAVEGGLKIESDPLKWVNQESENVQAVRHLGEETGFESTMGVLVKANNVADPAVIGVMYDFITEAEARDEVATTSSLVSTLTKIIDVDGATPMQPRPEDIVAAAEVAPDDVRRVLFRDDFTATQVNLRLAPASLDERAVLVEQLQARLDTLIAEAEIPPDSILLTGVPDGADPIRATPSGLAVVGTGLLENLTANRAALTYLALAAVALWLVIRFRSIGRSVFTLVPVGIAVGLSSIVVGGSGLTLSPMTTVSGPLVIASCAEFAVLITARYLEERQRGLDPEAAGDKAAGRTGRAFFTSAATTIGGFAVLIGSALPLLRDFGIIVTLNVAIALLAALVVMPPLVKWADGHGWLATETSDGAVQLAAPPHRPQLIGAGVGTAVLIGALVLVLVSADTSSGSAASALEYQAQPLPTTTVAPTTEPATTPPATTDSPTTEPPVDTAPSEDTPRATVDASGFSDERPATLVGGIVFDALTAQGVEPNVARCSADVLYLIAPDADVRAGEFAAFTRDALAPVIEAARNCGVDDATIDATIEAGLPG